MAYKDNSLEVYLNKKKFNTRKLLVLDYITNHPHTTVEDIMKDLGFSERNSVAPRVSDLINEGKVLISGDTVNRLNHKVSTFIVNPNPVKQGNKDHTLEKVKKLCGKLSHSEIDDLNSYLLELSLSKFEKEINDI